jgi:hypothetical protein
MARAAARAQPVRVSAAIEMCERVRHAGAPVDAITLPSREVATTAAAPLTNVVTAAGGLAVRPMVSASVGPAMRSARGSAIRIAERATCDDVRTLARAAIANVIARTAVMLRPEDCSMGSRSVFSSGD